MSVELGSKKISEIISYHKGENTTGINSDNRFLFLLSYLEDSTSGTKKGWGHRLVGLIAEINPKLAFKKSVFSAENTEGIVQQIKHSLDSQEKCPIGIATCYKSNREGMGKAPFWYGRRGGITNEETLNRFLHGEGTENGYWDITDDERKNYPWLQWGYLKTIQQKLYPISESVVTIHPQGYDVDRKNHFVGRIWVDDKSQMQMEIKLGTTLLRDLNEETPQQEIIKLELANGTMQIGSSYVVKEILDKEFFVNVLPIVQKTLAEGNYKIKDVFLIIKEVLNYIKQNKIQITKINWSHLSKSFKKGLDAGINVSQQPKDKINIIKIIIEEALELNEQLLKDNPVLYDKIIREQIRPKINSSILSIKDTFLSDGSLHLLKDLFEIISIFGFSQIEIIGGKQPNGLKYAMIYEIS